MKTCEVFEFNESAKAAFSKPSSTRSSKEIQMKKGFRCTFITLFQ